MSSLDYSEARIAFICENGGDESATVRICTFATGSDVYTQESEYPVHRRCDGDVPLSAAVDVILAAAGWTRVSPWQTGVLSVEPCSDRWAIVIKTI